MSNQINIKVTIDGLEELTKAMIVLAGSLQDHTHAISKGTQVQPEPEPEKPKAKTKPKAVKPETETPPSEEPIQAPDPIEELDVEEVPDETAPWEDQAEEVDAEDVPEYTMEDVRIKLVEISRKGKKAEAKALITEHGVSQLSDLDPKFYADVMKKAEAL